MPVSPFQRAAEGGLMEKPTGPTYGKKKRKARQRKRKLYQEIREELQLSGDIPTVPEGAIRPERVAPSAQGSQPLPELIAQAIRKGWAVDDGMKPHLVDELVQIVMSADMPTKAKVAAFNALRMADQSQWERDNPETAGKAKGAGGAVNVSIQTNLAAASIVRGMIERGELEDAAGLGNGAMSASTLAGALGGGGYDGAVEEPAAPASDRQGAGEGLEDAQQ